ncbi:MAG: rhodanese-like domain-containing protein [Thermomicrobiales bacterium]
MLTPAEFQSLMQSAEDATVLDVRSRDEWKTGHIENARNAFAGDISAGAPVDIDRESLVMLTCASGYRSRVAASMLQSKGISRIVQLDGGMDAWDGAGLPVANAVGVGA